MSVTLYIIARCIGGLIASLLPQSPHRFMGKKHQSHPVRTSVAAVRPSYALPMVSQLLPSAGSGDPGAHVFSTAPKADCKKNVSHTHTHTGLMYLWKLCVTSVGADKV